MPSKRKSFNDVIDARLGRTAQAGFIRLAVRVLCDKAKAHGVTVTPADERRVAAALRAGVTPITFRDDSSQTEAALTLSLESDELAKITERVEAAIEKTAPALVHQLVEEGAADMYPKLVASWPNYARSEAGERVGFEARLEARWRAPMDGLGMMVQIARELGQHTNERYARRLGSADEPQDTHLVSALLALHARACQAATEVLILIRSGYADAAMARWRTLHELAVTAIVIFDGGNSRAERFIDHFQVESLGVMRSFQKHAAALGYDPIDQDTMDAQKAQVAALKARYGPVFTEHFGWVTASNTERVSTFEELERTAGLEHLRPFYKLACDAVHAHAKGAYHRLGLVEQGGLLMGASNFGFADPGQNAAISLAQATAVLAHAVPSITNLIGAKILGQLADQVISDFAATQALIVDQETAKRRRRARTYPSARAVQRRQGNASNQ